MKNSFRARALAGALLSAMLAVTASRAQAQGAVITGKVSTEFGQPLEGANVYIAELSISVGTNAQGGYTINLGAARVRGQAVNLRVRSFGYVPQILPIRVTAGTQSHDFSLKQDVNRLAEVVVTGVTAGTEQRKLAFAATHVDEREMPVPAVNPLTMMAGKVPGAQIVSSTGRPGTTPSILLRGPKSINASGRGQSPLIIVDNIELQGSLADVNPQDIESIEVVKGAAASSLYGARAGNGVIQITTKSGKGAGDGVHFSLRSEYGRGDIERKFPLAQNHMLMMDETRTRLCTTSGTVTCGQTVDFNEEAKRINELASEIALPPVVFLNDFGIARSPKKPQLRGLFQVEQWAQTFDPVKSMVSPGLVSTNTIDASGRAGVTNFFSSISNTWQQGAIRYLAGFKRNSVRVNVDQNIGEDWSVGVRSYYARTSSDGANQEQGTGFFRLTRTPVGVDLLRTDKYGRLYIRSNPLNQGEQNQNPAYEFQNNNRKDANDRFLGSLTSKYIAANWLDFDGTFSYDRTNHTRFSQRDRGFRVTGPSSGPTYLGNISEGSDWSQSYNASINGTAHRSFGRLNARYTARYLYEQQDGYAESLSGNTLAVPGLETADAATAGYSIGSSQSSVRSIGVMNGIALDFKERYGVDALWRKDGSSLFGQESRWADYGRGSIFWRVSEEPWWFLPKAVNDLKLRASFGTAGGRPSFSAQYETFDIGTGGVLSPNTLGNKHLRPETTFETELGGDLEFFSRYGLNVTYAHDITKDQILQVPPPAISGFTSQWKNAGTLENKTWELSLNVPLVQQRNVNWSTRFNYDRTRTYITKLLVPPYFTGTNQQGTDQIFRMAEGERYGTFYGRKFVTSCSELPTAFQAQCGGAGMAYQKNKDGLIVWVGQGNSLSDGITKNLWQAQQASTSAPWGVATSWGMPMILRDATGKGQTVALGNALPDYRVGLSSTFNYKRLFLYGQLDASVGQYVWNEGRHWSLGDFMDREEDQGGKSVADARPIGYYWRAQFPDNGAGVGGFYDFLGVTSMTLERSSFAKIREVSASYNWGPVGGVGDWTISLIGRNLKTFTNYTGFDPEVGLTNVSSSSGSSVINAVDAFGFPNTRTFTLSLGTKF